MVNPAPDFRKNPLRYAVFVFGIVAALAGQESPSPPMIPSGKISPPPARYHFPDNRIYTFSAEWHRLVAGTGVIRMERDGQSRKIVASAVSSGAVNMLFPVRDRFESRFDPQTFCSQSITKHSEEGSHKRETAIHFNYETKKSFLDETNLRTSEKKHVESDLPLCASDVLTGFYYLQSLPLQIGDAYEFPVSDGKTATIRATVEKREHIKVPAGNFSTILVAAETISGSLQSKGKLWIWYSDDTEHTPVQMRARLSFGTLFFRLQRIEN